MRADVRLGADAQADDGERAAELLLPEVRGGALPAPRPDGSAEGARGGRAAEGAGDAAEVEEPPMRGLSLPLLYGKARLSPAQAEERLAWI